MSIYGRLGLLIVFGWMSFHVAAGQGANSTSTSRPGATRIPNPRRPLATAQQAVVKAQPGDDSSAARGSGDSPNDRLAAGGLRSRARHAHRG